jgi:hypothetical protein
MKLRNLAVLILLACPGVSNPQVRPRVPQPSAPPAFMQQLRSFDQVGTYTRVVLKNGVTILVTEAHSTPLVEVRP